MTTDSSSHEDQRLTGHLARASALLTSLEAREALKEATAAMQIARTQKNARAMADALSMATLAHYYRGDFVAAVASGLDAMAAVGDDQAAGGAMAMYGVALAFAALRDFDRAKVAAHRTILLAAQAKDPLREGSAFGVLGAAHAEAGETKPAVAAFQRSARRYRQLGDMPRLKRCLFNTGATIMRHGTALSKAGHQSAARHAWSRALRYFRLGRSAGQSRLDDINNAAAQAECNMLLGRLDEARIGSARAARNSKHNDLPVVAGYLAYIRGEIARRQGRQAVAERLLTKAMNLLDKMDVDHGPADCRAALANLAEERGEAVEAARLRVESARMANRRRKTLAEFQRQVMPMWNRYLKQGN